jgi:hypothetical protein
VASLWRRGYGAGDRPGSALVGMMFRRTGHPEGLVRSIRQALRRSHRDLRRTANQPAEPGAYGGIRNAGATSFIACPRSPSRSTIAPIRTTHHLKTAPRTSPWVAGRGSRHHRSAASRRTGRAACPPPARWLRLSPRLEALVVDAEVLPAQLLDAVPRLVSRLLALLRLVVRHVEAARIRKAEHGSQRELGFWSVLAEAGVPPGDLATRSSTQPRSTPIRREISATDIPDRRRRSTSSSRQTSPPFSTSTVLPGSLVTARSYYRAARPSGEAETGISGTDSSRTRLFRCCEKEAVAFDVVGHEPRDTQAW